MIYDTIITYRKICGSADRAFCVTAFTSRMRISRLAESKIRAMTLAEKRSA
ncbi:MAG: hypothetical protein II324_08680 [Selenomonadales bacterium]|nr:hypothetical protein [Selenomonadales bacterium]